MKEVSRLLPVFAIATGVALVTVTSAFKAQPKDDFLYYSFNTSAGDNNANLISNWTPVTETDYENSGCSDLHRACMIKAASAPSSVPYIQETGYKDPVADGTVVVEVKNRSSE